MKRFLSLLLAIILVASLFPVQNAAAESTRLIALTFDDGPANGRTETLLNGLKARGVKVTFFTLGNRVKAYPSVVKRAYEDGHEIGCHSWNHPELTSQSNDVIKRQFQDSYAEMDKILGSGPYLVRAPYGSTSERVRNLVNRPFIDWSIDSLDWEVLNAEKVKNNIINKAYDGAVILAHDIHATTVTGTLQAIDVLLDRGYEFVTISELFRRRGVELQNAQVHYNCRPTGVELGPVPVPTVTCTPSGNKAKITLSSTGDAPIYYTTDGSQPLHNAKKYTGPFLVDYGTEIRAVSAYKMNGSRSDATSYTAQHPDIFDVSAYRTGGRLTAPKREGKVFAGWYTDAGFTTPLKKTVTTGTAYAKFVDADVLGVKWQISSGTTADSPKTNLRLLTSVDSLSYDQVGFTVETAGKPPKSLTTKTVYRTIFGYTDGNSASYQPTIFSKESKYFMAHTLSDIPRSDFGSNIVVTPKWTTLDGTEVTGTALTFKISDDGLFR